MCEAGNRAEVIAAESLPSTSEWKGEVLPLEPVDELSVLTVCDNVTDILLPDQGPAKRLPLDRGDLDMRAADLRRDVPPEVLPRDHLHRPGRDAVRADLTRGNDPDITCRSPAGGHPRASNARRATGGRPQMAG